MGFLRRFFELLRASGLQRVCCQDGISVRQKVRSATSENNVHSPGPIFALITFAHGFSNMSEYVAICDILKALFRKQKKDWQDKKVPEEAKKTYAHFIGRPDFVSRGQLDSLLSKNKSRWGGRACMCLPPLDKLPGFIPVLLLKQSPSEWIEDVSFRVVLYRTSDGLKNCIGFRFEGPHHGTDDSKDAARHAYYHVQMIRSLEDKAEDCLGGISIDWLPETVPGIPVFAHSTPSLLLCIVLSLYGRNEFEKFFQEIGVDGDCHPFPRPDKREQISSATTKSRRRR